MSGRSWRTLTVAQTAEVAEVSVRTVRAHLASGRLKGVKVGRDWMISERDVVRWLDGYTPYDTLRGRRHAAPTDRSLTRVADKAAARLGYRWVAVCRHCGDVITAPDARTRTERLRWRHRRADVVACAPPSGGGS